MPLDDFNDFLSVSAFDMTKEAAHAAGVCIKCKLDWQPRTHSPAAIREYRISGLCETCWDEIMGDQDDD